MKLSANYVKNFLDTPSSLNGHEGVVTILQDNTADINEHNNGGVSPIYVSSSVGHAYIVKLLTKNVVDVDSCNLQLTYSSVSLIDILYSFKCYDVRLGSFLFQTFTKITFIVMR